MFALIANARLMAGLAAGVLRARIGEERGQDLIEYAVFGGILAAFIVGLGAALAATGALSDMADGLAACLDFAGGC